MRVLLISPEFPETFWSFKHALKFISKKASLPPLGLLTVAAMLPKEWEVKLVDMNVAPLTDADLAGAGLAFISAISVQKQSAINVAARCRRRGVKVVAGGPLFTAGYDEFSGIDHFVLNEAEITLPLFLHDLKNNALRRVYTSPLRADIRQTPVPRWEIVDLKRYASMNVQYSRGCPFNCDFCDITLLFGHQSRTKDTSQVLAELDAIYARGWRGQVFFVDDNFIGNRQKLKTDVLPAIARWMRRRREPFTFNTQASINIADDPELMRQMVDAGFLTVFVGIETTQAESLAECNKGQNTRRDLLSCVHAIQRHGLEVQAGFIVGFDHDPPAIFEKQIAFIQESGIVTAMVGLLNALKGTKLYERMKNENRLLHDDAGNNTDGSLNFIPKMDRKALLEGYRKVVATIYSPGCYYRRVKTYLARLRLPQRRVFTFKLAYLAAFFRSLVILGIAEKERVYFWRLLFWTMATRPRLLSHAVTYTIYGYHYRKVFESTIQEKPAADGEMHPAPRDAEEMSC